MFVRACGKTFRTLVFDALEKIRQLFLWRSDPSMSRHAGPLSAPPPCCAPPHQHLPVLCLGFASDISVSDIFSMPQKPWTAKAKVFFRTSQPAGAPSGLVRPCPNVPPRTVWPQHAVFFHGIRFEQFTCDAVCSCLLGIFKTAVLHSPRWEATNEF